MKRGLVLEGGSLRGLFTAGILDVMMDNNIPVDGIIGVSAGACFGCNYKSNQPGRVIRYNKRFGNDPRNCGLGSLIKTGNYFNAEFAYHIVPNEYDIFDVKNFNSSPIEYYVVCTDVTTGKPVYKKCEKAGDEFLEWIRASSSMPLVSKVVNVGGMQLLDGGVADSVPLEYFESIGYDRNIVILTQPEGYVKHHLKAMPFVKLSLRKYPAMIKAMDERHLMYNKQLDFLRQAEQEGRCLVIRPEQKLKIGHLSTSPEEMQRVYDIGRKAGEKYINDIKVFFEIDR